MKQTKDKFETAQIQNYIAYTIILYANLATNAHNKHSIPVMHICMHSGSQAGTVNSTILLKHCYDHMDSIKIIEL